MGALFSPKTPDIPPPPPPRRVPPPPTPVDAGVLQARQAHRQRAAANFGRNSTILTGGGGLLSPASTTNTGKTLTGQ